MNKSKGIVLLIAATMLTVGLASTAAASDSSWRSSVYEGEGEPNTGTKPAGEYNSGDFDDEGMWQTGANHSTTQGDQIYFDSVTDKWFFPFVTSPNAGSGHTGGLGVADTDVRNYGVTYFHAYLGYWKDCNGDGFIGDADTGAAQYPAAKPDPLDENPTNNCPAGTLHNDGTTVFEFLAIGPNARDVDLQGTDGSVFAQTCPSPSGGPSGDSGALGTPRPSSGNVVCPGGNEDHFVQDDFAKVWHDWGFPKDEPADTRLLFPLPDGTLRDSNGNFRYVDSLTFGSLSGTDAGCATGAVSNAPCLVWPSEQDPSDPAEGRQCQDNAARSGEYTTSNVGDIATNAEQGTLAVLGLGGSCDQDADTHQEKSPVPNVRSVDLGVFKVDYPTHTVEERYNNSENPNNWGTPVTEPVTCSGPQTDPDAWDGQDEGTVGDPLYGYSQGQEVSYAQSLVAGESGPSVQPTADKLAGATLFFAGVNAQCYGGTGDPTPYDNLELAEEPSVALKKQADTTFGFTTDDHFNPSDTTSGPDTTVCVPSNAALFDHPVRCGAQWFSGSQWFHSHGLTSFAIPGGQTASWTATFYADVSVGVSDAEFDPSGDGAFPQSPENVGGVWDPQFAFDADHLPGGVDDDHQYGDAACDDTNITNLFGGSGPTSGDDFAAGDNAADIGAWDCDRRHWAEAADLNATPSDSEDEKQLWLTPKVGDAFDLWDADCYDNDVEVLGTEVPTTDESGQLGSQGGTDCDTLYLPDRAFPDLK